MALRMTEEELEKALEQHSDNLISVGSVLNKLGYHEVTEAGVYRSVLLLDDDFSPSEVAMTIALFTFAQDIREASKDLDALMRMPLHALDMIETMRAETDLGRVRESVFLENANILRLISIPGPSVAPTIENLLQGSMKDGERLASSKFSRKIQRLRINDYDLSAVTNEVNKWQSHGKFSSYDVSKRDMGIVVMILENVYAQDGSAAALEIHKIERKSFFGKKGFWVIQLYKGKSQNGPFEKRGCVNGKMLVGAIMEAERDMKFNFISVASFELMSARATN